MKNINAIELEFENCEILHLDTNVLGDIYLGKISTEISRIACNAIVEHQFVEEVALEIFSEAENSSEFITGWGFHNALERIKRYNDITHIIVFYEDGTEQIYCIDYESNSEALGAPNINQKVYRSTLGNLYVVISKEKDITDFFDKQEIENKEEINFKKKMYQIGVVK